MKNIVLLMLLILISGLSLFAQDRNNEDEVIKLDPQLSRFSSVPNELLVKFKDATTVQMSKVGANKIVSGVSAVDRILGQYALDEVEQLLPNDNPKRLMRSAKAFSGETIREKSLNKLYRLKVKKGSAKTNIQLIEELKSVAEVEFVEPNYTVSVLGKPEENAYTVNTTSQKVQKGGVIYSSEPMYPLQWNLPAVKMDALWQKPIINSKRSIIAILDTGVDTEHPDLKNNIWTNANELNNAEGYDDDNNGFVDDIHGWDFINKTGKIKDFNSHGTHCAGIAAAIGDNGVGIAGANPNALIMPVAVMQSNGQGDIATLIKGINYAISNGADVLSMSIGTYANSIALEQALAQAYQSAVLVAAAGNDGAAIDKRCNPLSPGPMFPAAFTFVLGVEATQQTSGLCGRRTCWSNYDCDGPVFSRYGEELLYNYELQAPGAVIYSTVPGGQYKSYNGTSMAAPLVAGGISALIERKNFGSQEILWSTLIHSSGENVDFDSTYKYIPQPELNIINIETNDTLSGDKDMRPDAGEIMQIYPTIKNSGGLVDSIYFSLAFGEYEDNSIVEIIQDSVLLGYSLSAYAKAKSKNPLTIKLKSSIMDGRNIKLVLKTWYGSQHEGEVSQNLILNVENGVELKGMIMQDMTLYPQTHYIVTSNLGVPSGVTLTIKPGTVLKFKDNVKISCAGRIQAIGTPDSMIVFTKTDLGIGWGGMLFSSLDVLKYVKIEYINFNNFMLGEGLNSNGGTNISHSIIENCSNMDILADFAPFYKSNFYYNTNYGGIRFLKDDYYRINDSLFSYNNIVNFSNGYGALIQGQGLPFNSNIFSNNSDGGKFSVWLYSSSPSVFTSRFKNYYGSSKDDIIKKSILDFNTPNNNSFAVYDLSNTARQPYAQAHGIVWNILINGYDAQDEFDLLPPLGVGKHKFEIYFNRPMNKTVTPLVAMGVRPPYTQNAIAEDGSWNAVGDIYTVYYTIKGASTGDGYNRISVSKAKDNENFEIPFENQRFNAIVQAAGSMSNGFEATPGIGKIDLLWEKPEGYFDDLLGYNMYRYTYNSQHVSSDTTLVNSSLITDTVFADYNVVPGTTYNYMYKVLRTNLTENDYSKAVSTAPLTATKGDANGSFTVDVADVVSTVNYVTNQDPKPFIFEAADVNVDAKIDVLDIVGIINLILHPQSAPAMKVNSSAIYSVNNGLLYVDSPISLGGVQFKIKGNRSTSEIQLLETLNGFEQASQWLNDSTYLLLAYSLSGKEIPSGKNALLKLGNGVILEQVVLSDTQGSNIIAVSSNSTNLIKTEGNQLLKAFPNPFSTELKIPFSISYNFFTKVEIVFTDLMGRVIDNMKTESAQGANYEFTWRPSTKINGGIYFCSLKINGKIIQTEKVVYQP